MFYGIIGAMKVEIETIVSALSDCTVDDSTYITFYKGKLRDHDVVVCECSVATVNAAAAAQLMIDRFDVDVIINTGIAGGTAEYIRPLEMVVSKTAVFHDRDDGVIKNYFPHCTEFVADDDLITKAVTSAASINVKAYIGRVATGDTFVTSNSLKEAIINRCEPLCVEMEGAAIAQVAYMNKKPFVIIRTISDSADDNGQNEYDNFCEVAAKNSAMTVIRMIEV